MLWALARRIHKASITAVLIPWALRAGRAGVIAALSVARFGRGKQTCSGLILPVSDAQDPP
jgi:hypothetical protein